MDESRKPGDVGPVKDPWEKEEALPEDIGATGVFKAVPESSLKAGRDLDEGGRGGSFGDTPRSQPAGRVEGLREPIVHKVVLGGGSATAAVDIRELMLTRPRAAEAATSSIPAASPQEPTGGAAGAIPTPAARPVPESKSGQSSEGFTQLLRALGADASPVAKVEQRAAPPRAAVNPDPPASGVESGFTSLLRTLNPDDERDKSQAPAEPGTTPRSAPLEDGKGGFTALLQGFSGAAERAPRPPAQPQVVGQNSPGAFTELLRTLAPGTTSPTGMDPTIVGVNAARVPTNDFRRNPAGESSGEESSFTDLISTSNRDDRQSVPSDRPALQLQVSGAIPGSSELQYRVSDWSPSAESPERQVAMPGGAGEVTQLLQILTAPPKVPEVSSAPAAEPPMMPSAGGSLFTQTYRKLDEPAESLSPASPWGPSPSPLPPAQPHLSATQPYRSPVTGGSSLEAGPGIAAVPNPSAGPSEVTRIIEMSKLREMQRQGLSGTAAGGAAAAQAMPLQPAAPFSPPLPNLQMPQAPPVAPSWQPPQLGVAPQMPQMPQYTPPAPMAQPAMPAPQPLPAATPAVGKMQQYLPLLLIMIIFLLVVILVTMVFLLKH